MNCLNQTKQGRERQGRAGQDRAGQDSMVQLHHALCMQIKKGPEKRSVKVDEEEVDEEVESLFSSGLYTYDLDDDMKVINPYGCCCIYRTKGSMQ
eukprot:15367194-Ditylum_brightwellii.AAC.1